MWYRLLVSSLASPGIWSVSASCGLRFEKAINLDGTSSRRVRHNSEVEVDALGGVVKLAVGALVLTQLPTSLIGHYQRQARAHPGDEKCSASQAGNMRSK